MLKKVIKLFVFFPLKLRIYIMFFIKHGYLIRWSNPQTFSEKIQIRKLRLRENPSLSKLADKIEVREYVSRVIGSQYLIPLLWTSKSDQIFDYPEFDFETVMKTNHGSGSSHLEFFPTKKSKSAIINKFNNALREKYIGGVFGEVQYDRISPQVLIEKKLHKEGVVPEDYKFHVFRNNGDVISFLQVDFDRFSTHKRNYYDNNFNLLDLRVIYPNGNYTLPDIKQLAEMKSVAHNLLGDLDYARIDLYLFDGNVYFGEITLTPGSGFERFSDRKLDIELGQLWR